MTRPVTVLSPSAFRALLASSSAHSRVVPIDASWYMPNSPHNGKEQFLKEERIPGAGFFDLDKVALPDSKYPHMLPPYLVFKEAVAELGLQKKDNLVVYDKTGVFSSPRAAWTFSLFGHGKVYLLNHYPSYKKHEYPLETTSVSSISAQVPEKALEAYDAITEEQFQDNFDSQVIGYDELLALVQSGKLAEHYHTFDARSSDRYAGTAPEPRPGLPSGHVPGSLSLPFAKVLKEDGTYKTKEELVTLFKNEFNIDLSDPTLGGKEAGIIVMCGTGVTAVILRLAIESVVGAKVPIRVYDGSWTEWAQRAPPELIAKA